MNNLDIERATWTFNTLLYGKRASDSFESKELIVFGTEKWEALKAVPLDKILQIGEDCHIKMNGAGPESWRFDVVPDRPLWLFGVDFEPPANSHDFLYAIGGSKEDFICANLYFHYQMRNACRNHFPNAWKFGFRYGCITSRGYYEAVAKFGLPYFVKRQ